MPAAVRLRPMSDEDRLAVLGLEVAREDYAFVDPIHATLAIEDRDRYVIEASGAAGAVGYFQVDNHSGNRLLPGYVELQAVQIDMNQQGRGLGKAFVAAVGGFLKSHYPDAAGVYLTVNCRNLLAYRLYEFGGFADHGALYHGGRSGPQHIMQIDWNT